MRSLVLAAHLFILCLSVASSSYAQGGGVTTFSVTTTWHDNFAELSASERVDTFLTRLVGELEDGTGVVDQSLAAALDDPAVQTAIQAARTQLTNAGALQIAGPTRVSRSETPLGSTVETTDTLNHVDSTFTVTNTIGPADILIGDNQALMFHVAAGDNNVDVHTHYENFIDRLTTTTTTYRIDETQQLIGLLACARPPALAREVVAATGTPAPGAGDPGGPPAGTVLTSFGAPAVADDGSVAALVKLGPKKGIAIYVHRPAGASTLPAIEKAATPGLAGAVFKKLRDPVLGPDGALAFVAKTVGGALPGDGVWTDAFGPLARVLAVGGDVPGLGGTVLTKIRSVSLQDGELVVLADLGSGPAVLRIVAGIASVALQVGMPVAGSTVAKLSAFKISKPSAGHGRTHGAGRVLAKVKLADGREAVVDVSTAHALRSLVAKGDAAPEIAPGATWKKLGLPAGGTNLAGERSVVAGQVAGAGTKGKAKVLAFATDDDLAVFLHEGDAAPDGAVFKSFLDPVLSEAGKPAFVAKLKGGPGKTGLFWGPPAAPALTARLGDAVPDANGQPVAGRSWKKFVSLALPGCLEAGPIFLAKVAPDGLGLWGVDSSGVVRELLRAGATLDAGGAARTIKKILTLNAPKLTLGAARSYNQAGSVAAQVIFTDKTQALVRIDIP